MHGLLTTLYDATDVTELGADQRTDGGHDDHSHAIDFAQFFEKCINHECLRYIRAVSLAVR